ncbi:MAG: methionyl-tRNA formyltransferase [Proteobacteria bacterium]|nr:methionyl-tRNA formyltransferase [Pseudomonadota bacterium]
MHVVFMGAPEFAVPSLQKLIASDQHKVVGVFTQPPRPAGRGMQVRKTPVHEVAEKHGIPVFTPARFKGEGLEQLQALHPDMICVAAYGLLLPQSVLDVAPCLNVHPSALPRWRGAAPLHHTILAGDTTTEVCIMHMEKGLDSGPVYLRLPVKIKDGTTTGKLHDDLATLGASALMQVLKNWPNYRERAAPQHEENLTYAHKLTPEMKVTDFGKTAHEVRQHILGMCPFPGATTKLDGVLYKLLDAKLAEGNGKPGTVLSVDPKGGLIVACGEDAVRLTQLQREGKKPMSDSELLRGGGINVGDVFA